MPLSKFGVWLFFYASTHQTIILLRCGVCHSLFRPGRQCASARLFATSNRRGLSGNGRIKVRREKLKKVKLKNFLSGIIDGFIGDCEKYAAKHKNFGIEKICTCQKVGVTLHSLSGNNGSPLEESTKDIEKLTIDKK